MSRFTLPRDIYHGKGCLEELKNLKGTKAILVVGGGSMKRQGFLDRAVNYLKEAGMEVEFSGSYPGWKPKPGAEIIKIMTEIYEKDFGAKPHVVACHAGLECGIIGANYPKMEMVST